MIDSAGAIYVLGGGGSSNIFFNDVWASTDGGADRTRAGYPRLMGYSSGTNGTHRVYSGAIWDT